MNALVAGTPIRCCLVCAHFSIDVGHDDYYQDVAGAMECAQHKRADCPWTASQMAYAENEVDRLALITVASKCPYYKLMELGKMEEGDGS